MTSPWIDPPEVIRRALRLWPDFLNTSVGIEICEHFRECPAGPGPTPEPAACDVDKFDGHSLDALCPCGHSWREHRGQGYGPCLVCIVSRGPGPTDDERPARETVNDCLDTWEAMDAAELRTDDERPATGETQR